MQTISKFLLVASLAVQCFAGEWKLVWADEFSYEGLPDPKRWRNETGFLRNGEAQYYTSQRAENARVEGGNLIIEARREQFPNREFKAGARGRRGQEMADYTSASLTSEGLGEWRYGRIEVRAKLPQGRGVWPAIWMLGTNHHRVGWPRCGEIDIMEFVGFKPDAVHANIHTGKYNHAQNTGKGKQLKVERPFGEFHRYAIEWTAERIDFFFDENKDFTYEKEPGADLDAWPFDQPFYLILNLAIGGAWGGREGIDDSIFAQRFEIDYVRVYQK